MDFELHNGHYFAVIKRQKGAILTDPCPFCGIKHEHGKIEGHVFAHCDPKLISTMQVKEVDGIAYMPANYGYILRDYGSMTTAVSDSELPQEGNENYMSWVETI